jgi:serine protease Do
MQPLMRSFIFRFVLPLALLPIAPAQAATSPLTKTADQQPILSALTKANAAVVGVKVSAVDGARSAQTLGSNRSGSGVVIGADGLVLTIGYLMLEAEKIEIITQEGKALSAVAVAYDLATGFGLIKPLVPLSTLRGVAPVTLGSLQDLKPGEPLMAATGASLDGIEGGVSMTRLVSRRAFSGTWEYHLDTALFTSPPVSSGRGNHSGAPLFNRKGELIGIGSLLVADALGENKRNPGNMFVPTDLLKPILAELQQSGSSKQSARAWLGVTSSDQGGRVQVMRVSEGSPAEEAGVKPGTIVQAIDGVEVTTLEAFYKKLWARETPEQPVKLTVREGEEVKTIDVTPQNRMLSLKKPAGI